MYNDFIDLNKVFIIPIQEAKPLKIVFEDYSTTDTKTETYHLSEKEVLLECIKNLKWDNKISTQQYRSEKGKIRKCRDLICVKRFLHKHNITNDYIESEIGNEQIRLLVSMVRPISTSLLKDKKIGIYRLE